MLAEYMADLSQVIDSLGLSDDDEIETGEAPPAPAEQRKVRC